MRMDRFEPAPAVDLSKVTARKDLTIERVDGGPVRVRNAVADNIYIRDVSARRPVNPILQWIARGGPIGTGVGSDTSPIAARPPVYGQRIGGAAPSIGFRRRI